MGYFIFCCFNILFLKFVKKKQKKKKKDWVTAEVKKWTELVWLVKMNAKPVLSSGEYGTDRHTLARKTQSRNSKGSRSTSTGQRLV